MTKWTVVVSLRHNDGRVEIVTIKDKSLPSIMSALDCVPVSEYKVLSAKGERRGEVAA